MQVGTGEARRHGGRHASRNCEANLGTQRQAGHAHAGREHLRIEGRPHAVRHGVQRTVHEHAVGEDTHPVTLGNRPEVREHHQGRSNRTGNEHGLTTDPVGKHGGERNRNQAESVGGDRHQQHGAAVKAVTLGGEGKREGREDHVHSVDHGAHGNGEHGALVVLEDQHERGFGELFTLQVGGRLGESAANQPGSHHHEGGEPEGYAPAPAEQVLVRQCGEGNEHGGCQ